MCLFPSTVVPSRALMGCPWSEALRSSILEMYLYIKSTSPPLLLTLSRSHQLPPQQTRVRSLSKDICPQSPEVAVVSFSIPASGHQRCRLTVFHVRNQVSRLTIPGIDRELNGKSSCQKGRPLQQANIFVITDIRFKKVSLMNHWSAQESDNQVRDVALLVT